MTCPQAVKERLATLPWVEPDTIAPNGKARQVRFAVKRGATFDLEAVKRALGPRYAGEVAVLVPSSGP